MRDVREGNDASISIARHHAGVGGHDGEGRYGHDVYLGCLHFSQVPNAGDSLMQGYCAGVASGIIDTNPLVWRWG
jgi:hypothetical protein